MVLDLKELCSGLPLDPLPPVQGRDETIAHAPVRNHGLTVEQQQVSLKIEPRLRKFYTSLNCKG